MALDADALAAKFAANLRSKTDDKAQGSNDTRPSSAPERKVESRQPKAVQKQQGRDKEAESLPESPEIEKAALGAIFEQAEVGFATFERSARKSFFSDPIKKEIFERAKKFYAENGKSSLSKSGRLDLVGFTEQLRDAGRLDALGGPAFVTELFVQGSPSEMLGFYIEELREKYVRRQIIMRSFSLASKAKTDDLANLLEGMTQTVEDLKRAAGGPNGMERFALSDLSEFDVSHDPDCLVGRRWLVRGGSCLIAGTAGVGKSTLAMQLAIYWGAGETVFGPRPVRPLKSLIIQAEDDKGDVAEQYNGVLAGIKATDDLDFVKATAAIEKNMVIYRCAGHSGSEFLAMLDGLAEIEKPDLIWVNPLFSFAGADLMNAKETGGFLREGLFPIGTKRKACIMVIHHIGKPARKDGPDMPEIDVQYLGFGTSEIQNAFRAINVILPDKKFPGTYKLTFSKRGSRAGAKSPSGTFTQTVHLEQSREGLCWLQIPEPKEKPTGRQAKFSQDDILIIMSFDKPATASTLQAQLFQDRDMSRRTFFNLWDELKEESKIVKKEDGWIPNSGHEKPF